MDLRLNLQVQCHKLYDALNRLIGVTEAGSTTQYTYNGDGALVAKTQASITTRFLNDLTHSNQLLSSTITGQTTWYVWAPVGGATERIVFSRLGSTRRWMGMDAVGSPRQEYDNTGKVVRRRTWTIFGEPTPAPSAGIGYTGAWQESTGLVAMGARWYNPKEGRFLSRDPWHGTMTDPKTTNPYSYVENQPTRWTDTTGRWTDKYGKWHPCNLKDDTAQCLSEIPEWFESDEPQKAREFVKGIARSVTPDPLSLIPDPVGDMRSAINMVMNFPQVLRDLVSMPADLLIDLIHSFECRNYGRAGELTGQIGQMQLGGALAGVALVDDLWELRSSPLMQKLLGACSFTPDTPVSTPDGSQPIATLSAGDTVLAYDETTATTGTFTITNVLVHTDPEVIDLHIDSEQLTTTPEHPFSTRLGWVAAGDLTVGTPIWTAAGTWGRVEAVTVRHDPQPMYNLTVATAHTYFVGDGQWLVHNSCLEVRTKELLSLIGNAEGWKTIGIVRTIDEEGNIVDLVAQSGGNLHGRIQNSLLPHEVPVPNAGRLHAEAAAFNYAEAYNLNPIEFAASRPICPNCASVASQKGVIPVSPLK